MTVQFYIHVHSESQRSVFSEMDVPYVKHKRGQNDIYIMGTYDSRD